MKNIENAIEVYHVTKVFKVVYDKAQSFKEKFIHFRSHLLEDNDAIMTYKNEMYVDENKVWHVLMFCSMIADIMILVNSEGFNYARYCSIICNGGEQVEKRYSIGQRYPTRAKNNCRRTTAVK